MGPSAPGGGGSETVLKSAVSSTAELWQYSASGKALWVVRHSGF